MTREVPANAFSIGNRSPSACYVRHALACFAPQSGPILSRANKLYQQIHGAREQLKDRFETDRTTARLLRCSTSTARVATARPPTEQCGTLIDAAILPTAAASIRTDGAWPVHPPHDGRGATGAAAMRTGKPDRTRVPRCARRVLARRARGCSSCAPVGEARPPEIGASRGNFCVIIPPDRSVRHKLPASPSWP